MMDIWVITIKPILTSREQLLDQLTFS